MEYYLLLELTGCGNYLLFRFGANTVAVSVSSIAKTSDPERVVPGMIRKS